MRVLIVEDDKDLSKVIEQTLLSSDESCEISTAQEGNDGYAKAMNYDYDVIILDLMLGKLSGMEVLKEIRRTYLMPVIILSALSDIDKKIDCFRLGADDYMTKPFAREELMARVEACLRRTGGNFSSTHYKFRNMEVNYVNKMMTVDGNYVPMNRKTYEILELLVRNKEIIMTKQQIFDRIWGYYSTTGTSVIEINIFRLRKILSEYGLDVCLKTIKATGYMWTEKI